MLFRSRQSDYITRQSDLEFDENTNLPKPNKAARENNKKLNAKWFVITCRTVDLGYDTVINDRAKRLIYQVSTYNLQLYNSQYFNLPRFQGVHKRYYYWFTGQNNAVLDYKETHNKNYIQTMTGIAAQNKQQISSSMTDIDRKSTRLNSSHVSESRMPSSA